MILLQKDLDEMKFDEQLGEPKDIDRRLKEERNKYLE